MVFSRRRPAGFKIATAIHRLVQTCCLNILRSIPKIAAKGVSIAAADNAAFAARHYYIAVVYQNQAVGKTNYGNFQGRKCLVSLRG